MPPFRKSWLHHDTPEWVPSGASFFLTLCCRKRETNTLAHPEIFKALVTALEVLESRQKLYPSLVLAMPDHLHAIVERFHDEPLDRAIADLKRFIARKYHIEWEEGFFEHRLRDADQLRLKWRYIERNPVEKGLVEKSDDWPYVWKRPQW